MPGSQSAQFVPTWLTSRLPTDGSGPVGVEAALLFADISGFSTLAARLDEAHGARSAELLSAALDRFFAVLLSELRRHGGEPFSFAGDGLLACFEAGSLETATARAAGAAVAMMDAVAGIGAIEGVELGLHAGITAGHLDALAVGGHDAHWLPLLLGAPIRQLGTIFSGTSRGEIVLSPEALAHAPAKLITRTSRDGRILLVEAPRALAPPNGAPPAAGFEVWVPDAIRRRASQPEGSWAAENRTLTTVFILLGQAERSIEQLPDAVRSIQRELAAHHGTLHQVAIDDKGVAVTCAFGLPRAGADRPAASAVRLAMAVREDLERLGLPVRIGLATGRTFVGVIGDAHRRELGLVGPVMIRAARLAANAGEGIAMDEATTRAAEADVPVEAGPSVTVRRNEAPIPSYRPTAPRLRRSESGRSLVGRAQLLERLDQALAAVASGRPKIVALEGPPGIGKSSVLAQTARRAAELGVDVVHLLGDLASSDRPYHGVRSELLYRMGLDERASPADRAARATEHVERLKGSAPLAPLLSPVLGCSLPETPRTAAMVAQRRAEEAARLTATLLTASSEHAARLVILDDAQWLDGASTEVLAALRRRAEPTLVLVGLRTGPDVSVSQPIVDLIAEPGTERIEVRPLADEDAERLVAECLGIERAPPTLSRWVLGKASGNPFFVREVAASLLSSKLVQVAQGRLVSEPTLLELEGAAVPPSVEAVVTSRIDSLRVPAQICLKAASVLGMRFDPAGLAALYPDTATPLPVAVDELERAGLARRAGGLLELAHRIVLDVAYGLMVGELRMSLHAAAAAWLEGHSPEERSELAWHWERAGDVPKALTWLEAAWTEADREGTLREVHALGARASALIAAQGAAADGTRRARWLCRMADASANLSQYARAITETNTALSALGRALPSEPSGWRKRLGVAALQQLGLRAFAGWRAGDARAGDGEAALALTRAGEAFYFVHKDATVALTCFLESLNAAERAGPEFTGRVPNSYGIVGVALAATGMRELGRRYLARGLAESERVGDRRHIASSHFHMASFEAGGGDWDAADRRYDLCASLCDASGARYLLVFVRTAQALNALIAGRVGRADEVGAELNAVSQPMNQHRGIAVAQSIRARLALLRGDLDEAARLATSARDTLREREEVSWTLPASVLALTALARGERASALHIARELIAALRGTRPNDYRALEGFAAPLEIFVAVPDTTDAELDEATKVLARFARTHRIGRARMSLLSGAVAVRRGRKREAEKLFHRAVREAEEYGMVFERSRAELALERLNGVSAMEAHARLAALGVDEARLG